MIAATMSVIVGKVPAGRQRVSMVPPPRRDAEKRLSIMNVEHDGARRRRCYRRRRLVTQATVQKQRWYCRVMHAAADRVV